MKNSLITQAIAIAFTMHLCLNSLAFDDDPIKATEGVKPRMKYAIAIHGGAGSNPRIFTKESNDARRNSMRKALEIGQNILNNNGTSLEAVEKVLLFLEDDPQFNAGVGAVFNAAGSHELDASIMNGKDLSCGAVAGVSKVKNPISLARMVMTDTPHVLLAGIGAEEFAEKMGVEMVEPNHFDTKRTLEAFQRTRAKIDEEGSGKKDTKRNMLELDTGSYHGTVGCVALDAHGNLAAATSTGGMTNKQFGRIGDSPIVGAGTYADNKTCAVSCTGHGEQYIRNAVAYDVAAQMRYRKYSAQQAVKDVLNNRLEPGAGGIIVVDKDGGIVMDFTTGGMARAAADSTGKFEVLWGENLENGK